MTASTWQAEIRDNQLLLKATIRLSQFADGWQSWTFPANRIAVERATLGEHPAILNRDPQGRWCS